jgi:DNA-binding IclR family transcriptional regulator
VKQSAMSAPTVNPKNSRSYPNTSQGSTSAPPEIDEPKGDAKGTAALTKGISLLNAIARGSTHPTARELSEATGLPRPTVYRLLSALERQGLVRQNGNGGAYRLGPTLVMFAHRALEQIDIRDIAHEHLESLRDTTGETVHLAVFNKNEMLYIDKVESLERVRMACIIGASVPLHTTAVGKSFVAALPDDRREILIRKMKFARVTQSSITSASAFRAQIACVRKNGYAVDEEENERDIVCFGAPILGRLGEPLAAISVSVPRFRLRKNQNAYIHPLLKTCDQISKLMGFWENGDVKYSI